MTTPRRAEVIIPKPRDRIRATLSRRQHVESLSMLAILMVIQSLVELRQFGALGLVTLLSIGLRDILIVLLFAEEEGLIHE